MVPADKATGPLWQHLDDFMRFVIAGFFSAIFAVSGVYLTPDLKTPSECRRLHRTSTMTTRRRQPGWRRSTDPCPPAVFEFKAAGSPALPSVAAFTPWNRL